MPDSAEDRLIRMGQDVANIKGDVLALRGDHLVYDERFKRVERQVLILSAASLLVCISLMFLASGKGFR